MATHDFCLVDNTRLSVEQLRGQVTPEKKHLMIIPKRGKPCKMALYANYQTRPLSVVVDLLDTLLKRLTHRIQVLMWQHCQSFGTEGGYDLEALVKKITSLSVMKKSTAGDIRHFTYVGLVQIVSNEVYEDDAPQSDYEDDQDGEGTCVGDEDPLENDEDDCGMSLGHLMNQIKEAKEYMQAGRTLDKVNLQWVKCLLQRAECGLLLSSLQSSLDWTCLSTSNLREELMLFVKSKTESDRIKAAHLFGSLLSRDFLAETSHANHVEEDVCASIGATPLFLPWKESDTLTMEQPLFGPEAFKCNLSSLEDREEILDDIWNDQERSLRLLQEDVNKAPQLLALAVTFWKKGVSELKEKRQRRNEKARSRKKARHQ